VPVSLGWLRHSGYGMRFYSEYFYWEYFKKRAQDKLWELNLNSDTYNSSYSASDLNLWLKFNAEISEAEKNARLADPTVWKADPDQPDCD
jgi:hypothetical protein